MLEITLLGPFHVAVDGEPVQIRPGRGRAVLARLALDGGRTVARDALMDAVWGEDPPASAANVIQVAVSTLRSVLGADAIRTQASGYALGPALVDLLEFERRTAAALRAAEQRDHVAVVAGLAPLLPHHGAPLEGVGDFPFVEGARGRIEARWLTVVETHAAALIEIGRAEHALHLLADVVPHHPLREGLLEQQMVALAATGRETEALTLYEDARERIADLLGVDPGRRLQAAHRRVLQQDLPPQGSAAARRLRTGLLETPPPIIGRTEAVDELLALVRQRDTRLLTLVGPGGIGKTRLAEAIVASSPTDSVLFATDGVPAAALATALVDGIVLPPPAGDPTAALLELLRSSTRTVLVLDDVQSAPETDALISHLLAGAPTLTVVVTARSPLRLPQEVRYRVEPLAPTDAGGGASPALLLLEERMRRMGSPPLTDGVSRAVREEIAVLCDGMPLAIELAAAAAALLSPVELRDRLRGSLSALGRIGDGRHASVSAALESGLADLPPTALRMLEAAALFRDGGTPAALAAVADLSEPVAHAAAGELVDRGLLRQVAGSGRSRLRLLVPVRDVVLDDVDEVRLCALRMRYIDHHVDRFARHEWFDRVPRAWADAEDLAAEFGNLRAALELAAGSAPAVFARMVARLAWSFTVLAAGEAWQRWREQALAIPDLDERDRFDLLVGGAADARRLAEAAEVAARLDDAGRSGWLLFRRIRTAIDGGELGQAQQLTAELAMAAATLVGPAGGFIRSRLLDAEQMTALMQSRAIDSLDIVDRAGGIAADSGRAIEATMLEVVRIESLVVAGRVRDAAQAALDLLEQTPDASPWLRGAALSLRGVALLDLGAVDAAIDAQQTAIALMRGSPWRIEQLEVLLRWAVARRVRDPGDADGAVAIGIWDAAMQRLGLRAWPIESRLLGEAPDGLPSRSTGEQTVRLKGALRAVDDACAAILDGRPLARAL